MGIELLIAPLAAILVWRWQEGFLVSEYKREYQGEYQGEEPHENVWNRHLNARQQTVVKIKKPGTRPGFYIWLGD